MGAQAIGLCCDLSHGGVSDWGVLRRASDDDNQGVEEGLQRRRALVVARLVVIYLELVAGDVEDEEATDPAEALV